jgi:hypothetical protein
MSLRWAREFKQFDMFLKRLSLPETPKILWAVETIVL